MASLRNVLPTLLFLAVSPLAHASTLVSGSATVTTTSPSNDRLAVSTTYTNSGSFSSNLNLNQITPDFSLFTLHINDTGTGSAKSTGNVSVTITFDDPIYSTFTLYGTVSQTTTYISLFHTYSSIGTVTWSGGNGTTNALGTTEDVFFADGAELAVTFLNSTFFDLTGRGNSSTPLVAVELLQAPIAPEPGSLALLGTGLAGMGVFMRRRFASAL